MVAVLVLLALVVGTASDAAVLCAKPKRDGTFNSGVRIRELCKSGEVQLDPAVVGFCCTTSTTTSRTTTSTTLPVAETLSVPFCGFSNTTTQDSYAGLVEVTVAGVGETTPGQPLKDAFYELALGDPATAGPADALVFRVARASQSSCTCLVEAECQPNVSVASLVVGAYPVFRPDHVYVVTVDLGAGPPERLTFGFADCGCGDNSGTFSLSLAR
jgi:hypothetical protein